MKISQRKILAIVGPTASGKTGLAVFLAKKFSATGGPASGWNGAEIISADSRQIYRGLDIGTGKDLAEYGDIKYHLIDICEPEEEFNMFDWLDKARVCIEDVLKRGKLPIIVGGTGLYVQALTEGFELKKNNCHSELVSESWRSRNKFGMTRYSREELDKMPLVELQKLVKSLPKNLIPNSYNLDLKNPRRLIRHIERAQSGEQMTKVKPDYSVLQIGINLPREELYKKIDKRVEQWFDEGFFEEVDSLIRKGVSIDWLNKIGLEYKILANYIEYQKYKKTNENLKIENYSSLDVMKQTMKYAIHAYARRQLTWFRRFPEIKWVTNKQEALELTKEFVV